MTKTKDVKKILGYDTEDPKQRAKLVDHLAKEWGSGKSMKEALGIPETQLEHVYSIAYHKYQRGEYDQAADLFRYLMIYDLHCYKYILGFAASLHRKKDYFAASRMYQYATLHAPTDPVPWFHAADCWIHTGEVELADTSLEMVERFATIKPKYKELGERAKLIREHIKKTALKAEKENL